MTPGRSSGEHLLEGRSDGADLGHEVVGEHHALLGGEAAEREADVALEGGAQHPHRQAELDGEVEVDVEELGPELEAAHVAVEVADVEAPQDRPLDLGSELPAHLVEVGVVPHVLDGAGEAAVAVVQRGGPGDRSPPVEVPLGVEGEVHADVLAPVAGCCLAGPGARHHEGGAGGEAVAKGVVAAEVGGVARTQVVAVDDQQAVVGTEAEALGQRGHRAARYPPGAGHAAPQAETGGPGRLGGRRELRPRRRGWGRCVRISASPAATIASLTNRPSSVRKT